MSSGGRKITSAARSEIKMPRLSDSMDEGTILRWLKASGDEIHQGEELVEIETDKANMTYEADSDGFLELVAREGDTLAVGEVIAHLLADRKQTSAGTSSPRRHAPPASPSAQAPADPAVAPNGAGTLRGPARVKASPLARRIARGRGVDLSEIAGSGPRGRIVRADVELCAANTAPLAANSPTPPPADPAVVGSGSGKGWITRVEATRVQQLIARRTAYSKATIPEFTVSMEIDMEACLALHQQMKAASPVRWAPSYNAMVVKACGVALREFPRANGSYRDGGFELHSRVNVGIAVAARDVLLIPTVFDADSRSLTHIAQATRELAARARDGELTPAELSGATFTVSNLGMYGVSEFTAVINSPQAAILAVGSVSPRPTIRNETIVSRSTMGTTLTCDHRILYGADAAKFLARIRDLLEQPVGLLA